MCQTAVISKNISNLGIRTFEQSMSLNQNIYKTRKLTFLNKGLDLLYDMLYDQFESISSEDYKVFGNNLELLLDTLNYFVKALKKLENDILRNEIEKLESNYSALYELNTDIKNYRLNSSVKEEITALLNHLPIYNYGSNL